MKAKACGHVTKHHCRKCLKCFACCEGHKTAPQNDLAQFVAEELFETNPNAVAAIADMIRPILHKWKHRYSVLAMPVEHSCDDNDCKICADARFAGKEYVPQEIAKADATLRLIARYGQIDGVHHKTWVIDQIARILTADEYDDWVREQKNGEDGPDTYGWDIGIAP